MIRLKLEPERCQNNSVSKWETKRLRRSSSSSKTTSRPLNNSRLNSTIKIKESPKSLVTSRSNLTHWNNICNREVNNSHSFSYPLTNSGNSFRSWERKTRRTWHTLRGLKWRRLEEMELELPWIWAIRSRHWTSWRRAIQTTVSYSSHSKDPHLKTLSTWVLGSTETSLLDKT